MLLRNIVTNRLTDYAQSSKIQTMFKLRVLEKDTTRFSKVLDELINERVQMSVQLDAAGWAGVGQ